jgi:hypothetical protein
MVVPDEPHLVTEIGRETAEKLIAERSATVSRLLQGWEPERHTELTTLLTRLAEEVGLAPAERAETTETAETATSV